jgi:hypothetical protein
VSKEVIEQLRHSVFGFDTMWVTSVENYEQVRQSQLQPQQRETLANPSALQWLQQ